MPTQEKAQSVAALRERLGTAKTAVLTEYRGLTVRQLADLRKQLKAASAEYKVVKNRLARLAVKDSHLGSARDSHFKGPTGLVITHEGSGERGQGAPELRADEPAPRHQGGLRRGQGARAARS